MTRYINKTLTCSVCGKNHEYNVLSSFSVFESYLDGYTGKPEIYEFILECPYCHNVAESITTEISEKEKNYILSDEYQKAFRDDRDRYVRRFVETAKRKEAVGQWLAAAHYWLMASWRAYDLDDSQESDYQNKAVSSYKNALIDDEPVQMEHLCVMVDLLRQLNRFEEAEYYAESCMVVYEKENATDEDEYAVLKQEMKLIRDKDCSRHTYGGE